MDFLFLFRPARESGDPIPSLVSVGYSGPIYRDRKLKIPASKLNSFRDLKEEKAKIEKKARAEEDAFLHWLATQEED